MPKSGWTYKSEVKGVKQALLRKVAKATRDTGKAIVTGAKDKVPSPDTPGPFALGALKAAIHLVDGTPANLVASSDPGILVVAVDEPLDYAENVERGGFDMTHGYRAPGPHLGPAASDQQPEFTNRVSAALRDLERERKL